MEWKSRYWPLLPSRFFFFPPNCRGTYHGTKHAFSSISLQELHPILLCSSFLVALFVPVNILSQDSIQNLKTEACRIHPVSVRLFWSFWQTRWMTCALLASIQSFYCHNPQLTEENKKLWLHMTTHPSSVNGSTKRWWFIPSALKLPVFRGKGLLLNKEMLYPTESTDIIELLIRAVILKVDLTAGFNVEGKQNYSRKRLKT